MHRGLILTSAPDAAGDDPLAWLGDMLAASRSDTLKVVPAWGMRWTPERIAAAARLASVLVVRTTWGDPSYAGGTRTLPLAEPILAEVGPWLRVRPDAWIEIGNEPLLVDQPHEKLAWEYRWHLDRTIAALRQAFPRAKLIAPAHIRNHLIRLGEHADGQGRWDAINADQLRRCDALGLHAYSVTQAMSGLHQLRHLVSGSLPVWLTEFALNEDLSPGQRAAKYRDVLDDLPLAGALIYHLDHAGGEDPIHFNPRYRLDPATVAALGAMPIGGAPQPPVRGPVAPMAPRPPVENVAMSRAHLTRGRAHGPVSIVVLHATAGRHPTDLGWLKQGGSERTPVSCHYYIAKSGQITQLVADHDTAWHAGHSRWRGLEIEHRARNGVIIPSVNAVSIGIELENRNTGRDPYPLAQYSASVALTRHLVVTYRILRDNLVRHLDISPGRKTDPAGFPWSRFVADVYEGL